MFVSITLIRLRSPFKIPMLIRYSGPIFGNIRSHKCLSFSTSGLWLNHYTMTVWNNEEDMKEFVFSKEHKAAMAKTKEMASGVKFYQAEMNKKPTWREAKRLIKENCQRSSNF